MANYKVSGNNVIANVSKLTEKELKTIKNYLALGYTLVPSEEKEVVPKKKNEKYTKAYIKKFLEDNAPDKIKEWEDKMNEQATDSITGELKFHKKSGKPVKKGIVNTFKWLAETFPKEYGDK